MVFYRLSLNLLISSGLPELQPAIKFSDFDGLSDIQRESIEVLQRAGIIGGFPDGTYKPNNPLTRAQAAAIFDRTTDIDGLETRLTTDTSSDPEPISPQRPINAD